MKIKYFSDLHLDHHTKTSGIWVPKFSEEDLETTLVIAGDIWCDRRFLTRNVDFGESWLSFMSKHFKYIILVLGNHDFYGCNFLDEVQKCKQEIEKQNLTNCFLLENDVKVLDNVKFIGSTLWTSINEANPLDMLEFDKMSDYKYIRVGSIYRKLKPEDTISRFKTSKYFIFENCVRDNSDQKIVVVTHMAPSILSIGERYKLDSCVYFYCSKLEYDIMDSNIDVWIHGHSHSSSNYEIENTKVLCNPRGYYDDGLNEEFNEQLFIEV